MGFLVMAEAFDEWRQPKLQTREFGYHKYFDEWSERDMTAMIERDRNHPSIVIWSAGNEVPDQSDPQGPATLQALMDIIRKNDPTRLITVACDQIAAEPKAALPAFLEKLDVVGYNYVDRWRDRREKPTASTVMTTRNAALSAPKRPLPTVRAESTQSISRTISSSSEPPTTPSR
jgi:beta-galactosidase